MISIILLILLGGMIAFVIDKLFLEDRFNRIALPSSDDDVIVLDSERLVKMLNESKLYEDLRRSHEVHRGRSLPRSTHRRNHLAQARNRGGGQGVLPPGKRSKL